MKTIAIIPAGGKGIRSGFTAPKQYLKFFGKELIVYTLEIFQKNKSIDEIIIAAEKSYIPLLQKLKSKYKLTKIKKIVEGGKERQDSVFNALSSISPDKNDLIAVHDAARPLLPAKVLTNAVASAKRNGSALVVVKARDTLIKGEKVVESYLDRNKIYLVQTPQIFKHKDLSEAMEKARKEKFYGTDESVLIKRVGKRINIVEGSIINFKITTNEDIKLFRKLVGKKSEV